MKLRTLLAALSASASLLLGACGQPGAGTTTSSVPAPAGSQSSAPTDGKVLEIGIVNYVSHPALDAVEKGFIAGLAEAGYADGQKIKLDKQNAQSDQATLTAIANQFAQAKKDLVLGIATPSAQALAQVITDKPILFGAVTDPVAAQLVDSWEKPGKNITGASDLNPVEDQLRLLLEIAPKVKTVGIVYSSGEINAEVQIKAAEQAAGALGITIKKAAVSNSSEVQQATESLAVDAIYVPTDNNVVAGIEALLQVAEQKKIPVAASDEGSVVRGAIASLTVNYEQQGRDVAAMAVRIFEGAKPSDLPVQIQKKFDLTINPAAAKRMGLEIPAGVVGRAAKSV